MGLCKVLIVLHTILFVSLLETSAEEPKCPMRYIEERVLEKMMSIELKSDMALEKLSDMKKKQEDEEKYAKRFLFYQYCISVKLFIIRNFSFHFSLKQCELILASNEIIQRVSTYFVFTTGIENT